MSGRAIRVQQQFELPLGRPIPLVETGPYSMDGEIIITVIDPLLKLILAWYPRQAGNRIDTAALSPELTQTSAPFYMSTATPTLPDRLVIQRIPINSVLYALNFGAAATPRCFVSAIF